MKGNFLQVKKFLEETYPELQGQITAGTYPIPPLATLMSNILGVFQIIAVAWIVFGGENLLRTVGFTRVPRFYYGVQEYGVQIGVALFFLLPQLVNRFAVSGSFEVYLDDGLIFSKLSEGRMPGAQDLLTALDRAGLSRR